MPILSAILAFSRVAGEVFFWFVLLIFILVVAGCGGGGAGMPDSGAAVRDSGTQNAQSPRDLEFAYYGAVPGMVPEVADHVTAVMVPPWIADQAAMFRAAHAAGLKIIWYPLASPDIYQQALALQSLGLLYNVLAVYPCDEPDINACADPAAVRSVMALFPGIAPSKLAVIYSASGRTPGLEHYDWVGVDDYGAGLAILASKVPQLRSRLLPHQRLILVPGGADPWRTDPMPFLTYALTDARVAMVMPFTWFSSVDGKDFGAGIGVNGMAQAYRAVGKQIK